MDPHAAIVAITQSLVEDPPWRACATIFVLK
jgi:hypothetical protein